MGPTSNHAREAARPTRPEAPARIGVNLALAGSLAVLLAHAAHYAFLTDDAFISFRYALNWSRGAGLVFNPGFDRVEGYTNFSWVVLLGLLDRLGVRPETSAIPLSFLCTAGLWLAIVWFGRTYTSQRNPDVAMLLAPWLLAITPSVAVWSSSGLETRLFELCITLAAFRLIFEDAQLSSGRSRPKPIAALLFALATLTRPDGLLIAACALSVTVLWRWRVLRLRLPWVVSSAALFLAIVASHYLFRFAYYGSWLPNTYYAKIDGRTWWELGVPYIEAFALEYALPLWIPLGVAGVIAHRRQGRSLIPIVFAAICIPHAIYIASIGGDHFEYRPLDLYFGFAFLLIAAGAADRMRSRASRIAIAVYLVLFVGLSGELPLRAHGGYPTEFHYGFPGDQQSPAALAYLAPDQAWLYRLPGLRAVADRHRARVRMLTNHFAGSRAEEHRMFLEGVRIEGHALRRLVELGVLAPDTHIGVCCVGAIPYFSGLRTLDRIGLTDANVARGALVQPNLVAHGKSAPRSYGVQQGVDFWSVDPVHLIFDGRDPNLASGIAQLNQLDRDVYFARIDQHHFLVAELLQGIDHARQRFPKLDFHSTRDDQAVRRVLRELRGGNRPKPALAN